MNGNVKYVHLFLCNETKFSQIIVDIINDPENNFAQTEHMFVTPHKKVYEKLKDSGVLLDSMAKYKLINKYAKDYDWIFVHRMCPPLEVLMIKKAYLGKIIWRTWGSDALYMISGKDSFLKRRFKNIVNSIARKRYQSFKAIGVANSFDVIDIQDKFGNVKMFPMPYSNKNGKISLLEISKQPIIKENDTVNILIGHSGNDSDQIATLEKLEKFINEPVHVYLILSYGNPDRIKMIEDYVAASEWRNKSTIIKDFLAFDDFVRLIRQIDIAIFDLKKSYALGNISLLLHFGKKLFVNRDGILRRGFDKLGTPYRCTDEIENMTFSEFIEPLEYLHKIKITSHEEQMKKWHELFSFLNQK